MYEFPFAFLIPTNSALPSSIEKNGYHIQYSLFAGISQSQPTTFIYKSASKMIQVEEIVYINTPDLATPLSATEQKIFRSIFHSSGSISFSVRIQRGGYCLGESIAISATAENLSTERIISLRASLTQTVVTSGTATYAPSIFSSQKLFVQGSRHYSMIFNSYDFRTTSMVGEFSHWDNILLPIPSQYLPPTSSSCGFIKISYVLNVTLVLHKKADISVKIPITIGSVPLGGQSEHRSTTNSNTFIIVSQTYDDVCSRKNHMRPRRGHGV